MKPILAVLVLYRMTLDESPTYCTFRSAIAQDPQLAAAFRLLVADNSPQPQPLPPGFAGEYLHDGENPGLASRYNEGLQRANAAGADWLLTLDQDTKLTLSYLQEMLELSQSLADNPQVVTILPKLTMQGRLYSPDLPQYRRSTFKLTVNTTGLVTETLRGFNSASLVRVSALNAIGGYPTRYWLDFLDHATFAALQQNGGGLYVMRSVLEHDLSDFDPASARAENILKAEQQFYFEYGTSRERFWRRVSLLRQVIGHGRRGRFKEASRRFRLMLGRL